MGLLHRGGNWVWQRSESGESWDWNWVGPFPWTRKGNCRGKADTIMDPPDHESSDLPHPLPSS